MQLAAPAALRTHGRQLQSCCFRKVQLLLPPSSLPTPFMPYVIQSGCMNRTAQDRADRSAALSIDQLIDVGADAATAAAAAACAATAGASSSARIMRST